MKLYISIIIILSLISSVCFAGVNGDCDIEWQQMSHSKHKEYEIKSSHSVAIMNNSGAKKSYEIRYLNYVRLIDMWQLTSMRDQKIILTPDENFNENYTLIGHVGRSEKGSYSTMAVTIINSNSYCRKYNTLKVH